MSAADFRAGDVPLAIERVSALLRSSSLPDNPTFRHLADQLAKAARCPGWIGTRGSGTIIISLFPSSVNERFELCLDDHPIWSHTPKEREHLHLTRPLPRAWKTAATMTATCGGRALLGSGTDLVGIRSVQGFVEFNPEHGLSGWAWHPADPEAIATLRLVSVDEADRSKARPGRPIRADDQSLQTSSKDGPARLRGFAVPTSRLPPAGGLRIVTEAGGDVFGSPVYPFAEERAAGLAAATLGAATFARSRNAGANPRPPDLWRPLPAAALSTATDRKPNRAGANRRTVVRSTW